MHLELGCQPTAIIDKPLTFHVPGSAQTETIVDGIRLRLRIRKSCVLIVRPGLEQCSETLNLLGLSLQKPASFCSICTSGIIALLIIIVIPTTRSSITLTLIVVI